MTEDALHGKSALAVKYYGGSGPLGVGNRGIGNEGLYLSGGKPYEGYLFAAADVNSGSGAGGGIQTHHHIAEKIEHAHTI